MTKRINVTKSFLPPINEYNAYLKNIWESGYLTNQGPLLLEFEEKIRNYLNVENFQFVANGTIALQLALRSLGIEEGEVITTPFSYVATTSAIIWEKLTPVYVDIDSQTFNIDPSKIEAAITPNTKAILAVHVFGNPCDVESIEEIAKRHNLKVIYDAAHAFGVQYKGKSIFSFGDISICSFHSTKLMHTIEGGGIFTKNNIVNDKINLMKRFGHDLDEYTMLGINAKASEFQAAMGLCNLKYIDEIISKRKKLTEIYDSLLNDSLVRQQTSFGTIRNYGYYPVVLEDEKMMLEKKDKLNKINIFPRRYFYPSLNNLPYLDSNFRCPISEEIASKILCLPLFSELEEAEIKTICKVMNS